MLGKYRVSGGLSSSAQLHRVCQLVIIKGGSMRESVQPMQQDVCMSVRNGRMTRRLKYIRLQ
jgi:hypothetical protein